IADAADTAPVTMAILGIERVRDRGRLKALASVEIVVGGVAFEIHGIAAVAIAAGEMDVRVPTYRDPHGASRPVVILPPEMPVPLARLVADQMGLPAAVVVPISARS